MNWPYSRLALGFQALLLGGAALLAGCSDEPSRLVAPSSGLHAKPGTGSGGSGPSVSSVDPAHGKQGEISLEVRVYGSGFDERSQASWERDGVADPKITVNSTNYISSKELVANITIASDADLDLYDVAVTTFKGKKGVGMEMFEVTQAVSIGTLDGNAAVEGVNDSDQAVGFSVMKGGYQHAFFWSPSTGMLDLGDGHAWDIDEAGSTIVGTSAGGAAIWMHTGGGWSSAVLLPRSSTSAGGNAFSVASDPTSGHAILISGFDGEKFRGGVLRRPVLWKKNSSGWSKFDLAMPVSNRDAQAWVRSVNAKGQAAGTLDLGSNGSHAVFWDPNGIPTIIGPPSSAARAINTAGTLITGFSSSQAVYWSRPQNADGSYGAWDGPIILPGDCVHANDVDDSGRILASGCGSASRQTPAVFLPPYSEPFLLGGLGDRDDGGSAGAISRSGSLIGGRAPTPKVTVAAIWRVF